jgi:hypothetical protein
MTREQIAELKAKCREQVRTGFCQFDANDIFVSSNARVEVTEGGAWVHAQVWVPRSELEETLPNTND